MLHYEDMDPRLHYETALPHLKFGTKTPTGDTRYNISILMRQSVLHRAHIVPIVRQGLVTYLVDTGIWRRPGAADDTETPLRKCPNTAECNCRIPKPQSSEDLAKCPGCSIEFRW